MHIKKIWDGISKCFTIIKKYSQSPETYARSIGVHIGKGCFISTRGWSSEPYLVYIGNNVQVTQGVMIHTHGGGNAVRHIIPDFDTFGKVIIEDGAYVGAYTQIMPGVRIGKNAIVAAGSIVTKSVPEGIVVGGNPAKYICTVEEYIKKNEEKNFHTHGLSAKEKGKILRAATEDQFISKLPIRTS